MEGSKFFIKFTFDKNVYYCYAMGASDDGLSIQTNKPDLRIVHA